MSGGQETHRSGPLKQSNKTHNTGRHRSKGALDKINKGKVSIKVSSKKGVKVQRKVDRKHQLNQHRQKAREAIVAKQRQIGGAGFPPVMAAVVPLASSQIENADSLVEALGASMEDIRVVKSAAGHSHMAVPRFKQRFAFVQPKFNSLYSVLDAAKVCDTVIFLLCPHEGMDAQGEMLLTSILSQGLPTSPVMVVGNMDEIPPKKHTEVKKLLTKAFEKKLPIEKLYTIENSGDAQVLIRALGCQKRKSSLLRERRAHMLAEEVEFTPDPTNGGVGTLAVTGYVRGQALSVNRLVHISGWGDFQLDRIETCADINTLGGRKDVEMGGNVLAKADPQVQQEMDAENIPDGMDGEQTWPTEEELEEADKMEKKVAKKVPRGMSEYQTAWIADELEDGDEEEEDDDEDSEEDDDDIEAMSDDEEEFGEDGENDIGDEVETMTTGGGDEDYDAKHVNFAEEVDELEKMKAARMEEAFPDEVDTPADVLARTRFQKYRGLKSFRSSPWDAKENLPYDYARTFQFENFQRTKKRVLAEEIDGAEVGWYVTVYVKNVGSHLAAERSHLPVVLSSLLPHEHRMSVLNVVVRRSQLSHSHPVQSKERLVFHCGFRRFAACPVFSQHTNGDKHKYERYFRQGDTVVMTMFAPITFPPASVLVFQERSDGEHGLLATGTLLSVDPNRIIVKRTVLSGHPFKVHKRISTVRFMFFNREDIEWFKPIELRTKQGRRGHIKDALGTHGHMKCIFDGQISQQDTVLMNLFKRVFPKWTYDPHVNEPIPSDQPKPRFLQLSRASSQKSLDVIDDVEMGN